MNRRILTALVSVVAVFASILIAVPASATSTTTHDSYFDPHADWSGEEDNSGAVAMNDAGTVAVFMRPFADSANCPNVPRSMVEIYVGLVGKTSTAWQSPIVQSSNALPGGCASFTDRHEIILNAAGTVGYALVASTIAATVDNVYQTTTSEFVIKFSIDALGQARIMDHFAFGICASTDGCTNPFNFNLHMSAKTGDVFASVMNIHTDRYSSTVTDLAYFNATSSTWTHASLSGVQGLTSGISRDGKTTFVAGPEFVGTSTLPKFMRLYFCKGAFSPECIAHSVSWSLSGPVWDVSSSIADNGSKLALGWSTMNDWGGFDSVAVIPLNAAEQGDNIAVNIRQMPSDVVAPDLNPITVFLSPTGNRVWAVMSASDGLSQVLTAGAVSGSSVSWGGYSSTPEMATGGAWLASLTRTGRLVIVRSNVNPEVLVADRSDAAAEWFLTPLTRGRNNAYTGVDSMALSADGSRWVVSGLVAGVTQPVAAVGIFKGILVAKKLPTLTGYARIGAKLTAHLGTWNVTRGASTYQWMRDGIAIDGATRSTYTTVTLDSGRKITVVVTYANAGYFNRTVTSAAKKMPGTIPL